ncbi:hypothetical protein DFH08DRAFT_941151 [Mycena albidolilacea]|uniref:Uncharacterized protein n=1 Tax=Mycena albidolilacea TaxID=1033008 RepID=A0AAD6ZJC5_9AGAR|nr:hypothetical protein DFH08DRAFT_941151 [Mycena albidolilacea]
MSSLRTTARKQMLSALVLRAGLFSDATNRVGGIAAPQTPTQKPMSRRETRQRTKKLRGIDATRVAPKAPELEIAVAAAALPADVSVEEKPPSVEYYIARAYEALRSGQIPRRIIRTLPPPPPPPQRYGPFESCSRTPPLDEFRTWEEDAWGVVYSTADLAGSATGPIEVLTLQAAPGELPSVQIFYG